MPLQWEEFFKVYGKEISYFTSKMFREENEQISVNEDIYDIPICNSTPKMPITFDPKQRRV